MAYWINEEEDESEDSWSKRHNDRERARPRYRLKDLLKVVLGAEEHRAREIVDLIEEMIEEGKEDVYDRVKERGHYASDY